MLRVSGSVGAVVQGGSVRRDVKNGAEPATIRIGLIISRLGCVLIVLSNNLVSRTIYLSIFGSDNALLRPCVLSLITQTTTVSQGVTTGLSSSMDSLGRMSGPLLAASVFYIHIPLPFIIGGTLCIAAVWL